MFIQRAPNGRSSPEHLHEDDADVVLEQKGHLLKIGVVVAC